MVGLILTFGQLAIRWTLWAVRSRLVSDESIGVCLKRTPLGQISAQTSGGQRSAEHHLLGGRSDAVTATAAGDGSGGGHS